MRVQTVPIGHILLVMDEFDVSKIERVELEDELEGHIEPADGDRVRLYRLC